MSRHTTRHLAGFAVVAMFCAHAGAFTIQPIDSDAEAAKVASRLRNAIAGVESSVVEAYVKHFSSPVHEDITHRAYGCSGGRQACEHALTMDPSALGAPRTVIEGVQWNDNPPFRLATSAAGVPSGCAGVFIQLPNAHPDCWAYVFEKAGKTAAASTSNPAFGPSALILQRSHYGDMQFLHAMAPDGEPAAVTKQKIMRWAEFTYSVATGKISPAAVVSTQAAGAGAEFFPQNGWDVSTLFTQGTLPHSPSRVQDIAFGSLLHLVEDSFSKAHVQRAATRFGPTGAMPGQVIEFHSYAKQDHTLHSNSDQLDAFLGDPGTSSFPINICGTLAKMRAAGAPWTDVEALLNAVFDLQDPEHTAGPGHDYLLQQRPTGASGVQF